jgi:hypothetical protein
MNMNFTESGVRERGLRCKMIGIHIFLVMLNFGAWIWAVVALHAKLPLLSTGFSAWDFGLRHTVDADHIVANDDVSRQAMQAGKKPVSIGCIFPLGHSAVVMLETAAVAATAVALEQIVKSWKGVCGACCRMIVFTRSGESATSSILGQTDSPPRLQHKFSWINPGNAKYSALRRRCQKRVILNEKPSGTT